MACSKKSFGITINRTSIFPKRIKCFHVSSKFYIVFWCQSQLLLHECSFNDEDKPTETQEILERNFVNPIVDIINIASTIYVIDIVGCIYELYFESRSDIFDASPHEKLVGNLEKCDKLLAISCLNNKFIMIMNSLNKLEARVCNAQPFQVTDVIQIFETKCDKVTLTVIDVPLHWELMEKYFSLLSQDDVEVPLIGLPNGEVHSFSMHRKSTKSEIVTSLMEPVVYLEYCKGNYTFLGESKEVCTAMMMLAESGSIVVLYGNSTQMLFVPGPLHCALACREPLILITSDGLDCTFTKIIIKDEQVKQESSVSPVKGIESLSSFADSRNIILSGTKQRSIYWLDVSVVPTGDPYNFVMPEDKVMEALLSSVKCLEELSIKTENEDSKLLAISIASRWQFLSQFFNILVKVYEGDNKKERLKIRLENEADFIIFTPDVWKLHIKLSTDVNETSYLIHLKEPFKDGTPLLVELDSYVNVDCELSCQMIGFLDDKQPVLHVPLGKIILDAGFFLSPVKNAAAFLEKAIKETNSFQNVKPISSQDTILSIDLKSNLSNEKVLPTVFCNSIHRMTKNQWDFISGGNLSVINAAVGRDNLVEIKFDPETNSIKFTSRDIKTCHQVRNAALARLGTSSEVVIDQQIFMEVESIKQSFEMLKLKPNWDIAAIQTLKNSLRSKVTGKLPV